jgi:RimJ/RimL family protein N-acetyltransferase
MVESDAEHLFALDSDPEVLRFVGTGPLGGVELYRERIVAVYLPMYADHPGLGFWAIEDGAGFVGWVHFRPARLARFAAELEYRPEDIELGYRLVRPAWGRGYATEVSRAVVRAGFAELGVESVVASALRTNVASVQVMEKVGLKPDGRLYPLPGYDDPAVKYRLASAS